MKHLTVEQKKVLNKMKQEGTYRDARSCIKHVKPISLRCHESMLFKIMKKYLEFRNWNKSFKTKYFNNIFCDCPLTGGEIRGAIRYGNRNNLLKIISGTRGNHSYKIKEN